MNLKSIVWLIKAISYFVLLRSLGIIIIIIIISISISIIIITSTEQDKKVEITHSIRPMWEINIQSLSLILYCFKWWPLERGTNDNKNSSKGL